MSPALRVLRHEDVDPRLNPTGEILLSRSVAPFKVWVPDANYLVLGNSQDPEKELHVDKVLKDGVPVFKRMSGGGAVLLSPGCVCIGLRFAKHKSLHIQDYFAMGAEPIREVAADAIGVDLRQRGVSDLVVGDRKVAGCALYMPRDFVLYLVSILVDPDFSDLEKYLAHPTKEPDYRSGRSHREFLAGLAEFSSNSLTAEDLASRFLEAVLPALKEKLDWKKYEEPGKAP